MSTTLFSLAGTRALITGSSQGLGLALAAGLGAAGAEIRDAEGRLLATVLGVEAAALAEADTFL